MGQQISSTQTNDHSSKINPLDLTLSQIISHYSSQYQLPITSIPQERRLSNLNIQHSNSEVVTKSLEALSLNSNPNLENNYGAESLHVAPGSLQSLASNRSCLSEPLSKVQSTSSVLKDNKQLENNIEGQEKKNVETQASVFKELKIDNYEKLQNKIKQISIKTGFLISQSTGLKKNKYAYFYCQNSKVNVPKAKKGLSTNKELTGKLIEKLCPFKLSFILNSSNKTFEFQEDKSTLYHDHELKPGKYIDEAAFKFIEEIMLEKNLSIKEVLEKVNLKYELDLNYSTVKNVYYSVKSKLFGRANKDAFSMIELLQKLQEKDFLRFDRLVSSENHLRAFIFVTKGMVSLYKNYNDMIIIDTTFGLNRFNMPPFNNFRDKE